jgi:hypothetical protein
MAAVLALGETFVYWTRVLVQCWFNSKGVAIWLGGPGLVILFFTGAAIQLFRGEGESVMEQLGAFVAFGLVPILGLMILSFIASLFYGPVQIDRGQRHTISNLENELEDKFQRRDIANGLAQHMKTCYEFILEKIDANSYHDWKARWQNWNDNIVEPWISKEMTEADVVQYKYCDLVPVIVKNNIHEEYPQDLSFLRGKADTLRIMMKHRLYRNI